MLAGNAFAFEHEESDVHFHVYNKNIVEENRKEQKPFFLLFAAEWCHWCHVFNEKTLTNEKVCLLYTSPSPRDLSTSRMPSSA